MPLQGKKIAILVEELYQELEVWVPLYRLQEEGAEVVLLGTGSAESYGSKLGYPAPADGDVHEADPEEYAGVVIPGGFAPDFMRRYPGPADFVRKINEAGKPVAAICHGLWIAASADILKGRKATGFFAIQDDIRNAGAEYVDQEVCVDGNLVTARKPDDLPAFMRAFIQMLEGKA